MDFLFTNMKNIILALGAIFLLAIIIKNYAQIKKFLSEVKAELKKASWATKEELMFTTVMVIVIMVLFTAFIAVVDTTFAKALELVLGG